MPRATPPDLVSASRLRPRAASTRGGLARARLGWFALIGLTLLACGGIHESKQAARVEAREGRETNTAAATSAAVSGEDCPLGFASCGSQPSSGCQTALTTDSDCGACERRCPAGSGCRAGACTAGVVELAAGGSHTCARRGDGQVLCWGLGGAGQLGPGSGPFQPVPEAVALPASATHITTGRYHTCVLLTDGSSVCFGDGGLLGNEQARPSTDLQVVEGLRDGATLVAASNHTCALRASGEVLCWGGNAGGQLGDDTTAFSLLPVAPAVASVVGLAPGNAHTCALRADRGLWCWGLGRYGQLGHGGMDDSLAPTPVVGLRDVTQASSGESHSCAVTQAGQLYCWGRNHFGQLGLGPHARQDSALAMPVGLANVAQVDAGERHTCAVVHTGELYCWGDNDSGQLGTGDQLPRAQPTRVVLPGPTAQVAAGYAHTCALLRDGAVYCFGQHNGQLGDGHPTGVRPNPVQAIPPATRARSDAL